MVSTVLEPRRGSKQLGKGNLAEAPKNCFHPFILSSWGDLSTESALDSNRFAHRAYISSDLVVKFLLCPFHTLSVEWKLLLNPTKSMSTFTLAFPTLWSKFRSTLAEWFKSLVTNDLGYYSSAMLYLGSSVPHDWSGFFTANDRKLCRTWYNLVCSNNIAPARRRAFISYAESLDRWIEDDNLGNLNINSIHLLIASLSRSNGLGSTGIKSIHPKKSRFAIPWRLSGCPDWFMPFQPGPC